ncbi:DUF3570 domain-containing protein [Ohtaekwangia sp.]|uniref:DUF3570 domain-containing protein n=1 Tax=Ohtaekwangia sp. TaxID=2066019 RepID=UPI002FDECB92
MKKRYVIIGLLASSLMASAQQSAVYKKKKLVRTDVEAMFSYYTQDNNHSAVTGGIGTEDLQVYVQQLSMDVNKDSVNTYHIDAGVDVISSASTDNIDYVMSSASRVDARSHMNLGFNRFVKSRQMNAGINTGMSIESDYLSFGAGLNWSYSDRRRQRDYSFSFQGFFDDLRWGRLENGHPQKLVYPVELRYKKWFNNYRRNSFNVDLGIYQVINRRMAIGIYPGVTYQKGLLSTPFHRVYFTDDTERVENLPGERLKVPVGVQLNSFAGTRWIIRSSYRFYWDNFGINAHTINVEAPVKINAMLTLTPFVRLYTQTGADYFRPYKQLDSSSEYYTSDYDLSRFHSYKTGLGVRYAPFARGGATTFQEVEVRYAFYDRSDGLKAHMITAFIHFSVTREKNRTR